MMNIDDTAAYCCRYWANLPMVDDAIVDPLIDGGFSADGHDIDDTAAFCCRYWANLPMVDDAIVDPSIDGRFSADGHGGDDGLICFCTKQNSNNGSSASVL